MIAGGEAAPLVGAKDRKLMELYERQLTDSLGPVNAKSLARDIARDKPLDIAAWVEARNITLLGDKTVKVLVDLYTEAAWYGVCIARAELDEARKSLKADNPELSVDWSGWVPGDPDAARLLLDKAGAGIQGLLDKAGITVKGINATRVGELGNLLARTVGEGASMGRTAAAIREMFGTGSSWAKTVAQTETRRAVTAASVDTYQEAGVESVEWLTAWGEACPICQEFQSMGPVLIGSGAFDGDDGPPGHPNCFCVVLPVIDPELLRPVDEGPEAEEVYEEIPIAGIEADPTFDRIYEAAQRAGEATAEGGYAGRRDAYNAYKQEVDEIIEARLKEAAETMTQEDLRVYEASLRYRMDGDMISAVDYYEATEEQRQAIVDFAETARRDATPMIAMKEDGARGMLQDGRYRTQFETGTSGGTVNLEARSAAEGAMFGTPGSAAAEARTVYGYASVGDPLSRGVSTYGEIRVELSAAVRDRTTITLGDSLGRAPRPLPLGEAITDQSAFGSIGNSYSESLLTSSDPVADRVSSFVRDAYIETQIQGGVSLSDIEVVYIPARMEEIAREFADAGIRVVRY